MIDNGFLSVSDFAKLARTTKQTLHHYDKIGLLTPVSRGVNKYRYYSIKQLEICNTIRLLHMLNVPLSKIKSLLERRTPELAEDILIQQIGSLSKTQTNLAQAQLLLHTVLRTIQSGLKAEENTISIQYLPAEPIILGEPNDYSGSRTAYDALLSFYQAMSIRYPLTEYDICYPVWGVLSQERIRKGSFQNPDRFYFFHPDGRDRRRADFYAVGYIRAGYGQGDALYEKMLAYIAENGFEISGNAYEEYPLNELGIANDANYLVRVLITVRKVQ